MSDVTRMSGIAGLSSFDSHLLSQLLFFFLVLLLFLSGDFSVHFSSFCLFFGVVLFDLQKILQFKKNGYC